jgi:hypothetical protein
MNDGREFWIGRIDPDRVHELFDVMVHYLPRSVVSCGREASHLHQTSTRANVPIAWEYRTWIANRWPFDCATPLKSMRAESPTLDMCLVPDRVSKLQGISRIVIARMRAVGPHDQAPKTDRLAEVTRSRTPPLAVGA